MRDIVFLFGKLRVRFVVQVEVLRLLRVPYHDALHGVLHAAGFAGRKKTQFTPQKGL